MTKDEFQAHVQWIRESAKSHLTVDDRYGKEFEAVLTAVAEHDPELARLERERRASSNEANRRLLAYIEGRIL